MKTLIISTLILCCCSLSYAKTLVWATEATYPPFESMNNQHQVVGMDADIARAICQQMHSTCKIVHSPWDSLIPSLHLGKFDVVFGAMDITVERAKKVNFSTPYFHNEVKFVAKNNPGFDTSIAGLTGKTIATQRGNSFEYYLQATYGDNISLKTYASIQEAFMDLNMGRVDAVLSDTPTIKIWLDKANNRQHYAFLGDVITDKKYFGAGYGFGIAKNNNALVKKINQALATLQQQGKLQTIIDKYTN